MRSGLLSRQDRYGVLVSPLFAGCRPLLGASVANGRVLADGLRALQADDLAIDGELLVLTDETSSVEASDGTPHL